MPDVFSSMCVFFQICISYPVLMQYYIEVITLFIAGRDGLCGGKETEEQVWSNSPWATWPSSLWVCPSLSLWVDPSLVNYICINSQLYYNLKGIQSRFTYMFQNYTCVNKSMHVSQYSYWGLFTIFFFLVNRVYYSFSDFLLCKHQRRLQIKVFLKNLQLLN